MQVNENGEIAVNLTCIAGKTGLDVRLPHALRAKIKRWPHFMIRKEADSRDRYHCKHVLGQIFDRINAEENTGYTGKFEFDKVFERPGRSRWLDDARTQVEGYMHRVAGMKTKEEGSHLFQ